ncbi:hypothetical protein HMI51_32905 [Corallococcus coralloides]|uniref:hypothetical protein n=1 Tax=unclassified Corallococcus TaxID=2685029 RepID=UPI0011C34E23|nr:MULTISPECIES: hypothetical protein [unclassified Corallococcus]NOJ97728.1 hypothetical protein [Corallococcus coralloides]
MSRTAAALRTRVMDATQPRLLQWQDVPTSQLAPYAPSDASLPMVQYAMQTVMAWAKTQSGCIGAIPTWEVGQATWGVILLLEHPAISVVDIPKSQLPPVVPENPIEDWGVTVMRWAVAQGYQLGIPTFSETADTRTALLFSKDYPGLTFVDADNADLFEVMFQPRSLIDLSDTAVWAQSVMRLASSRGWSAGWPTWEYTTKRGLIAMSEFATPALPDPTDANVDLVLAILKQTNQSLKNVRDDLQGSIVGVFDTFNAPAVTDPALQIGLDCLFGVINVVLNAIPEVGGSLAALFDTALTAAQDSEAAKGANGSMTLEAYQSNLESAFDASLNAVGDLHDALLNARGTSGLDAVWQQLYTSPLTGMPAQLGLLALASPKLPDDETYWNNAEESMASSFLVNLKRRFVEQLYLAAHRTYQNAPAGKQWWYGTIASVTAADGDLAKYIADRADDLSCWFTDFSQQPGHARGPYVTTTEFWLQSNESGGLAAYPPTELVYSLFSSDGFGNTQGWTGPYDKSTVYNQWSIDCIEFGSASYQQNWTYSATGELVVATVQYNGNDVPQQATAGSTDAYGQLTLNSSNPIVQGGASTSGFQQRVIRNDLSPLK